MQNNLYKPFTVSTATCNINIHPFIHSAAGGEIFNQCIAEREEAFKEKDVQRLMRQILEGVAFLHRNNVVHLDLKVSLTLL